MQLRKWPGCGSLAALFALVAEMPHWPALSQVMMLPVWVDDLTVGVTAGAVVAAVAAQAAAVAVVRDSFLEAEFVPVGFDLRRGGGLKMAAFASFRAAFVFGLG